MDLMQRMMTMNQAERIKAERGHSGAQEEGHYFAVVHMFCDFLTEAYYENNAEGKKWEYLNEVLKAKLPAEVYKEFFDSAFED
jgi:acyl-CoA thioesterase FadM